MNKNLITLMLLLISYAGFSQYQSFDLFGTKTNPYSGEYTFLTLDTLEEATTLANIHKWYRASWVDTYSSVELKSSCNGTTKTATGKSDTLNQEQLELLRNAGMGCMVDVKVDYLPKNTLKDNPPRQMNFSLRAIPIFEAKYPGGKKELDEYLLEEAVKKIPSEIFEKIRLAIVRFTINERGEVVDSHIFNTSTDEEVDELLLATICKMPNWTPARNVKGEFIAEEFEFSLGTMLRSGCAYRN